MWLWTTSVTVTAGCWALCLSSNYLAGASPDVLKHHRHHDLHYSQRSARSFATASISNTSTLTNNTLAEAQRLVAAAQTESQLRNAEILASPRRNTYDFRQGAAQPLSQLEIGGTVLSASSDSTGVNATVGAAVALIAEAHARGNMTVLQDGRVEKRASSYWMENMVQNGVSPYAPSNYKVRFQKQRNKI